MFDTSLESVLEEIAEARDEEFDWTNRRTWGRLLESVREQAGDDAFEDVKERMKEGGPLYTHRAYARDQYGISEAVSAK